MKKNLGIRVYPLMTPIGRIRATFRHRSRLVDDLDHVVDVLVGLRLLLRQALPAAARAMTPRASSSLSMRRPAASLTAAVRLITRPAPWQVVPKRLLHAAGWPTSTQLARPMSPGMITGWPMCAVHASGISGCPGGKARVAPLRWTQTFFASPSTVCSSNLAMLWPRRRPGPCRSSCHGPAEDVGEDLAGLAHEQLPVAPGVVGGRPHRADVLLPFGAVDRGAGELAVGQVDAVLLPARCGTARARRRRPGSPGRASRSGSSRRPCPSRGPMPRPRPRRRRDRRPALRGSGCPSRACRTARAALDGAIADVVRLGAVEAAAGFGVVEIAASVARPRPTTIARPLGHHALGVGFGRTCTCPLGRRRSGIVWKSASIEVAQVRLDVVEERGSSGRAGRRS